MKPLLPKFCLDLSARLKDIAEKHVPAKLKPIVVHLSFRRRTVRHSHGDFIRVKLCSGAGGRLQVAEGAGWRR